VVFWDDVAWLAGLSVVLLLYAFVFSRTPDETGDESDEEE
jgi:hypothetical protein